MKRHLNTLFVTTPKAYLAKDGETVLVRVEKETRMRVPIHNLAGIVCFGNVTCSPYMLGMCAERGVAVSFLTEHGRFLARVLGPAAGNVLLRREQYRRADDTRRSAEIARAVIIGKVSNARAVLVRAARESSEAAAGEALKRGAATLAHFLADLRKDAELDALRGIEGGAAKAYFGVFNHLIRHQKEDFFFERRSRRPPEDNVNSLLSFLYTLLLHDVRAAVECVGLDSAVGFLHRDRPGRPGLALDLMEEFRSMIADRVALSLINMKQIRGKGFSTVESGGVVMDDETRKAALTAYQQRKQDVVTHPFLGEKVTVGLLFHLQALLLARYLRGDLDGYPPFIITK